MGVFIATTWVLRPTATPAAHAQGTRTLHLPLVQTPRTPRVSEVVASRPRGLYDAPIDVRLSSETAGTTIRYTLDGSPPGAQYGAVYERPIHLERSTVLRAAGFRRGWIATPVATWSFLFPRQVAHQPEDPEGWPATWGHYAESHLVGEPMVADYAVDRRISEDPRHAASWAAGLRALPSLSLALEPGALFDPETGIYVHPTRRGVAWERATSAEWLPGPGSGEEGFQVDAGLRIAGNASRKHVATPKKSFSLRFTRRHGPPRLEHPLFPGSRVERFNVLRLRAVFNDSYLYLPDRAQYLRDRWARATQADMGMLAAAGRFVHLYLNGLYWGVYDLSEEPSASFMASHRGGAPEDWDVVKPTAGGEDGIEDGNRRAYEALLAARDTPGPAGMDEIERLLDVEAYIDYTLLQMLVGNAEFGDNWRAARRRDAPAGSGFVFFAWDFENVLDLLPPRHRFYGPKVSVDVADSHGVGGLHGRLRQDAEYRLRFADRAQRHLAEGGALAPQAVATRYRALADTLAPAMLGETARWGDHPPPPLALTHGAEVWEDFFDTFGEDQPRTVDAQWRPERDRVAAFLASRPDTLRVQLCREGLYPPVLAPRIRVPGAPDPATPDAQGDPAPPPREVLLEASAPSQGCPGATTAVIWYTLDGSDPRRTGGGFAPAARPASGAVTLPRRLEMVRLRARARAGATWSALVERSFGPPRITIDELHYHPAESTSGSTEFLELRNHEPVSVDLAGWRVRGVGLTLPPGTTIGPGQRLVVARDPAALREAAGLEASPLGYPGALSNSGERIVLETPSGLSVFELRYEDGGAWPRAADGHGFSLTRAPGASSEGASDPETWRGSRDPGGSPGRADPAQAPLVVINEVLVASPPEHQAIELINLGAAPAIVGGWGVGRDVTEEPMATLPEGLVIDAGKQTVVALSALQGPGNTRWLDLPSGELLLFPRDGSYRSGDVRGAAYGPHEAGVSWGRLRSAAGVHFLPLERPSLGAEPVAGRPRPAVAPGEANGEAWRPAVLLSEIMARPAGPGEERLGEYIELFNPGLDTVPLAPGPAGSGASWAIVEGVSLRFPPGAILAPRGRMVLTGGDPASFRSTWDVPRSVPVLGPWQGRLSNEGERVVLARPTAGADPKAPLDDPTAWIQVESLRYDAHAPWPGAILDGSGAALERVDITRMAGDPAAWSALSEGGSPGRPNRPRWRAWLPRIEAGVR